jgi:starch synthase (maltosyl-transferring)
MKNINGRSRVIIEHVYPEIDCGKYPVKRVTGEKVEVSADIYADGHNELKAVLLYRRQGKKNWEEIPMKHISNDRWEASFGVHETGWYEYTIEGWVDHFASWQKALKIKYEANQPIEVELKIGLAMMNDAREKASPKAGKQLDKWIAFIDETSHNPAAAAALVLGEEVTQVMYETTDRSDATFYENILLVEVERKEPCSAAGMRYFPDLPPKSRENTEHSGMWKMLFPLWQKWDLTYFIFRQYTL